MKTFEILMIAIMVALGGCAASSNKTAQNNLPSKDWNGLFDSDEWVWVNSAQKQ